MLLKTRLPVHTYPALSITKIIPAVEEVELEVGFNWLPEETYPVVTTPLDVPKRAKYALLPFVLTPCKTTVMRFTQLGILVKSMLVPLVEATAVPEVIALFCPEITAVPVTAGKVSVKSEALSALTKFNEPPEGFFNFRFAIIELPK